MNILVGKIKFYSDWYASLSSAERESWLGTWVVERIMMFSHCIKEKEAAVPRMTIPVGNYKLN